MISYKRPITTGQNLTNYKHLVSSMTNNQIEDVSGPCKQCAICGCYGKHNMSIVSSVSTSNDKK